MSKTANLAFLHAFEGPEGWRHLDYCHELFIGAEERAGRLGYSLDPVWLREPGMTARRLTRVLRARQVQGVVIGPLPLGTTSVDVEWEHFAAAAMGFSLRRPVFHRAGIHQSHSVGTALGELQNLGYRRLGVVLSPDADAKVDHAWTAGLAVSAALHPGLPGLNVLRLDDARLPEFEAWIRKRDPDVLLNAGALHIEATLARLGLDVPRDIGLVTMTGSAPIATVARDWPGIGAETVDLVVGQLNRNERGIPEKAKTVLLEGVWQPNSTVRRIAPPQARAIRNHARSSS